MNRQSALRRTAGFFYVAGFASSRGQPPAKDWSSAAGGNRNAVRVRMPSVSELRKDVLAGAVAPYDDRIDMKV